jgi:excisionase family DNA binding protein
VSNVYLSVEEIAERLGIGTGTVRTLIHEGDLVASRVRRQLRVSETDLTNYLQKAKVSNGQE